MDQETREKLLQEKSNKEFIASNLLEHIRNGNFKQNKKRHNDNIELTPQKKFKINLAGAMS